MRDADLPISAVTTVRDGLSIGSGNAIAPHHSCMIHQYRESSQVLLDICSRLSGLSTSYI